VSAAVLPPFRAAVLDLDGLVLDSESTYCAAWRLAAAELGRNLGEEFCHSLFGRHADDVEAALRRELGAAFDRERFHRSATRHWHAHLEAHGIDRMPGLEALLAGFRARRVPYALATNSDAPYALHCLRRAGLESEFATIVTRDQVARGKPAPDLFLEAARRLGVPPEACLALEDSETGLAAACSAGMIAVLVQRREALRARLERQARLAFATLGEVAEWMEAAQSAPR
jgi:HAD superfamily hydrolase (TIGR01509 family)